MVLASLFGLMLTIEETSTNFAPSMTANRLVSRPLINTSFAADEKLLVVAEPISPMNSAVLCDEDLPTAYVMVLPFVVPAPCGNDVALIVTIFVVAKIATTACALLDANAQTVAAAAIQTNNLGG